VSGRSSAREMDAVIVFNTGGDLYAPRKMSRGKSSTEMPDGATSPIMEHNFSSIWVTQISP